MVARLDTIPTITSSLRHMLIVAITEWKSAVVPLISYEKNINIKLINRNATVFSMGFSTKETANKKPYSRSTVDHSIEAACLETNSVEQYCFMMKASTK